MAASKETAPKSLEEQLKRLEEIASLLDRGDAPIDQQLSLFEEGMKLAESCRSYLEKAELKIRTLGGEDVL